MTSMVARLRGRLGDNPRPDSLGFIMSGDLDTLLTIVERFAAAVYPVDYNQSGVGGRLVCEWCEVASDEGDWMEPMAFPHDPDCPWLLARKACGMDGDA